MTDKTTITVFGVDPSEFRAEDEFNDDAMKLGQQIYQLLLDEYEYLDPTGVSVNCEDVPREQAPDFPDNEQSS